MSEDIPDTPEESARERDIHEHVTASPPPRRHRLRSITIGVAVFFLVCVVVGGVLYERCGFHGCPDVNMLKGFMPDQASVVLDRNGTEIAKLFVTQRIFVPIDSIKKETQNAFVAIEDQRFWTHGGVDYKRVIGALIKNVKSRGIEEGSSTITMQLARNIFPDQLPASKKTLWRKIGEAHVAREIEKRYSKSQILELYLNQIYFGHGAYGLEAASMEYFGKHPIDLTLAESATLAAMPRAPSKLNPRSDPVASLTGRKLVLTRMADQGMITADQQAEAGAEKIKLRQLFAKSQDKAPYFVAALRKVLEDQLGDAIYTQGYTIHTTLDMKMQTVLEQELNKQMVAIESGAFGAFNHPKYAPTPEDSADNGGTKYLQSAGIIMDATTGDVLALVGGRDFDDSEFDRSTQAERQPGSAFKPFVYAAALQSGIPPTHRILDRPLRFVMGNGKIWEPSNYDGTFLGAVTLRQALYQSRNVPTVRLSQEVGLPRIQQLAEQMGLGHIPSNPSVVLGTLDVTPMQLTQAYTAFATLGQRSQARYVTEIKDRNGGTVWSQSPQNDRVLDPAVAFLTTNILQDVVDRGTATAVRAAGFHGAAGGKTGTTQDAADVWFVGFTPQIVGTVWFGFDRRQTIVRGASGGVIAAPVWGRVMAQVAPQSTPWAPPAGIEQQTVDGVGDVVGQGCAAQGATHSEYFLSGTAPQNVCYGAGFFAYGDSLPYDSMQAQDPGWWQRMKDKYLNPGDTMTVGVPPTQTDPIVEMDTTELRRQRDSLRMSLPGQQPPSVPATQPTSTTGTPPGTQQPLGVPTRRDTTVKKPDTIPKKPDTLTVRPPDSTYSTFVAGTGRDRR